MKSVGCIFCYQSIEIPDKAHEGSRIRCPRCNMLTPIASSRTSSANDAPAAMNRIKCPACMHRLKYSDEHVGKKAKCQKCGQTFRLPSSTTPPEGVTLKATPAGSVSPHPALQSAPAISTLAPEDQEDKLATDPHSAHASQVIGAVAILLIVLCICGGIVSLVSQCETPEAAYIASQEAIGEGNFGAFLDRTTNEYQRTQILGAEIMRSKDPTKSHLKNLSGRELWIAIMKDATKGESKKILDPIEVVSTEISGNHATLKVRRGKGDVNTVHMVKQDGSWRMIIPEIPD